VKDPLFIKKWKDWARSPRFWRGEKPLLFATYGPDRVRCNGWRHEKYACTFVLESENRVDFYAPPRDLKDFAPWPAPRPAYLD
jgi:hypothetical protein